MNDIISLIGIPDNRQATVAVNKGTPGSFQINIEGTNDLNNVIEKKIPFHQVILNGEQLELSDFDQSKVIVNTISDADTSKKALDQASKLLRTTNLPIINHPDNILKTTRDSIYQLFKDIEGIKTPKTIRVTPHSLNEICNLIQKNDIAFPNIVRETGKHNGQSFLLEKPDQIHELEQFAFDGRDYYITEFVDFQSDDGLYRKARFFIVEGTVYPRHWVVSTNWNIHANSRKELMLDSCEYVLEEENFVACMDYKILQCCRILYKTLKLDFFGIDCNIDNQNNLLIFEINASMKPFSNTILPHLNQSCNCLKDAISDLFLKHLNNG